MFQYRAVLVRLRQGDSDRDVARARLMGRPKVAALRAHATQVTVASTGRACALSNNLALPIHGREHYVLVRGQAGALDERGWETDLLAGL